MAKERSDTETVYYRIDKFGRSALTAKNDTEALVKAKTYDEKWDSNGGTQRIVKSVNTVIWRKADE